MKTRFVYEPDYGELDTGATTLAFAHHSLGASHFPAGYVAADASALPLGIEIALVTDAVVESHRRAIAAEAVSLSEPCMQPWGQTVSYGRCPDGTLVELCAPVAAAGEFAAVGD